MKKTTKGILLQVLMIPLVLFMVSCNCKTLNSSVVIYTYDGKNYSILEEKEIKRYSEYSYPEYDDVSLDGYTFLGWVESKHGLKTLEDLEKECQNKDYYALKEHISGKSFASPSYYPLFVKDEELEEFLKSSPLAKVTITLTTVLDGKKEKEEIYLARLLDTFDGSFSFVDDIENYEFVGYSLYNISYEEYSSNGIDRDLRLDLSSRIEKNNSITIYAYYRSVK